MLVGKCFLNGREIDNSQFQQISNEAIQALSEEGIFETIKISKTTSEQLLIKHHKRLLRTLITVQALGFLPSLNLHKISANFLRQINILIKYLEKEETVVVKYQLLWHKTTHRIQNLIQVRAYKNLPKFLSLQLSEIQLPINQTLSGAKKIDRRIYQEATNLAFDPRIYDVLVTDSDKNIIEGAKSNIFILQNNDLYTPDLAQHGVAGVMREYMIEHALKNGFNVSIVPINKTLLLAADAIYISNAVIGVKVIDAVYDAEQTLTKYVLKTDSESYQNLLKLIAMLS